MAKWLVKNSNGTGFLATDHPKASLHRFSLRNSPRQPPSIPNGPNHIGRLRACELGDLGVLDGKETSM